MPITERDVVLTGKENGSETLDLPVTRLGLIEDGADTKATPVDNDNIPVIDSADGYEMKKTTWASIKAALKTYFDSLYTKNTVTTYTATISTTWTGSAAPYTQTISVSGILATDTPIVDAVLSTTAATARLQLEAWGKVSKIVTAANNITVTCLDEKPVTAIPIQLKVVR